MTQNTVPFVANPNTRCVPACFGMGLLFFQPNIKRDMADFETFCGFEDGKGTWKAEAMLNLAKEGYQVHWIEDFDYQHFARDPKKYLRSILDDEAYEFQVSNTNLELEAKRMQKYIDSKLPLEQRAATEEDIKRFIDDGWLVHLEVNASTLRKENGYDPHSVLITGYEDNEVILHNPDANGKNTANQHIPWSVLNQAWKEFGGSYSFHAFKLSRS